MPKAMIQDNSRCIGCRACMVACKEWNELGDEEEALKAEFFAGEGYQNPLELNPDNDNGKRMLEEIRASLAKN